MVLPIFVSALLSVLITITLAIAVRRKIMSQMTAIKLCAIVTCLVMLTGMIQAGEDLATVVCSILLLVPAFSGGLALGLKKIK